jgi:hypothetical protein
MDNQTPRIPCSQVTENLYDYLTGRLSPTLKPVIAEHLMSCSACRTEHDEMKITLGLLDQIKPPKVSDGFTDRVMQCLEPKVLPFTKRPVYRLIMQGTAAAIVILAVVSIIKLLPTTDKDILTTRGGATTTVIAEDCKKAIELYNKGTGTPDLKLKESLLKDALAADCTDNKVLARIHNNLADCYEQQGKLDEALAGYTKAIELDQKFYTACLGLGDTYKKMGKHDAAVRFYERAVALMEAEVQKGNIGREAIEKSLREIKKLKENK